MEPDTIPTDVPQVPDTTDAAQREVSREVQQKNDREAAMERLAARHTQIVAEENGDVIEPDPAPAPDQLAAQLNEPDAPPAAVEPAPAAAPPKVKVKVDGVEAEVPFDEVVRNYQKTAAADRKLAEAARMQREAAELQQQIIAQQQQFQQQLQQQTAQPPQPESPVPSDEPDESGRAFLKALFEGDEEAALAKLNELTAKGRQPAQPASPTLDVDQLAQQVSAHVQQKLVVESALAKHREDYPEIYADPDMEQFVLTKVNSRREQSQEDFFTALNSVSADFAAKFGWSRQNDDGRSSAPTPTTPARATKLERKAQIDNVTSINTKTTSTEAIPESASDVIAQMRQARLGS